MKHFVLSLSLFFVSLACFSQEVLVLDALETDYLNVPRKEPVQLTIKRSFFRFDDSRFFILEAGDNTDDNTTKNNLDGAMIIGNKFVWTADNDDQASTQHSLMLGNNINYTIRHNYFDRLRYTSVFKNPGEEAMEWTDGAHAYNIHKNTRALIIKGMSGVRIYNNTFYAKDLSPLYHISIEENTGSEPAVPATKIKIKNNIFYQDASIPAFRIRQKSGLEGLECDYNIYYCENREDKQPYFEIEGENISWDEWRALGFDKHSIIMDPIFTDTESFVPVERLNFGVDLGSDHATGLATTTTWELGKYPDTAEQNGEWQVGAVLYGVNTLISNHESTNPSEQSNLVITYPNPSTGVFTVELSKALADITNPITITSLDGKIVYNEIIPKGEYSIKIDLSNVSPGFYILSSENSNFSKKIRIK